MEMHANYSLLLLCALALLLVHSPQLVQSKHPRIRNTGRSLIGIKHNHGKFMPGIWKSAHATFYGGSDGSETTAGACGYEDTVKLGYGLQTAAVSMSVFNGGSVCGACFELKCYKHRININNNIEQWCKSEGSIFVTATNLCPPNYAQSSDNGGWCNPPRVHFDLTMPAFLQIAQYKAGIVPVTYRRVPCKKKGGIRFTMKGNRYFILILIWNVAGAGDVTSVQVRGNKLLPWISMKRNWGQHWQTDKDLTNQSLAFRVMTSDRRKCTSWRVTPQNWQFDRTYEGKNFRF